MLKLRGILIDTKALLRLRHRYDPEQCSAHGCCCSHYEVSLTPAEEQRILGLIKICAGKAAGLREDGALLNPFDREDGRIVIDQHEDGRCAFAYRDPNGWIRCAIHSAALELGLDPYKTKPRCCALWPLALTDGRPPILTVQENAYDFPCNSPRRGKRLDPGVAAIIQAVFTLSFARELERALEKTA